MTYRLKVSKWHNKNQRSFTDIRISMLHHNCFRASVNGNHKLLKQYNKIREFTNHVRSEMWSALLNLNPCFLIHLCLGLTLVLRINNYFGTSVLIGILNWDQPQFCVILWCCIGYQWFWSSDLVFDVWWNLKYMSFILLLG